MKKLLIVFYLVAYSGISGPIVKYYPDLQCSEITQPYMGIWRGELIHNTITWEKIICIDLSIIK